MKNKFAALLLALLGVCAMATAGTEPGSFVEKLCYTTNELVAHAKSDKRVMDRYMRHFAMSEEEVVSYLSGLRVDTADKDEIYTVYAAPTTGVLRSKLMKVKKGSKQFVDASGEVVLIWHCGNPVTRGPKTPYSSDEVGAEPAGTTEEALRLVPTQSPSAMVQANTISMAEPVVPDVPFVPAEESIPIASATRVPGWLGIIPAVAIITNRKKSNPVPEPTTIIVVAAGAAYMAKRRIKK